MRKSDLKTIKEVNAYIRSLGKLARVFYELVITFRSVTLMCPTDHTLESMTY